MAFRKKDPVPSRADESAESIAVDDRSRLGTNGAPNLGALGQPQGNGSSPSADGGGVSEGSLDEYHHQESAREKGRLGDQLVKSGLISEEQLEKALIMQEESGGMLGEVLVSMGALDEQALTHALAAFFGFEVANLRRDDLDASVIAFVPENVAREYMAIPLSFEDGVLEVAVAQPSDELRQTLQSLLGHPVTLKIAPLSDLRWAIDSNYQAISFVDNLVQAFESVEQGRKKDVDERSSLRIGVGNVSEGKGNRKQRRAELVPRQCFRCVPKSKAIVYLPRDCGDPVAVQPDGQLVRHYQSSRSKVIRTPSSRRTASVRLSCSVSSPFSRALT